MISAFNKVGLKSSLSLKFNPAAIAVTLGVEKLVPTFFATLPFTENDFIGLVTNLFLSSKPASPPKCVKSGLITLEGPGPFLENEEGLFFNESSAKF